MSSLTAYVAVFDENGAVHSFGPGSDVPPWAKRLITNPKVWDGGLAADEDSEDSDSASGPPPKAGKGSGESAWRSYAEEQGIDVSGAEGRDDIIDALDKAGVAVE